MQSCDVIWMTDFRIRDNLQLILIVLCLFLAKSTGDLEHSPVFRWWLRIALTVSLTLVVVLGYESVLRRWFRIGLSRSWMLVENGVQVATAATAGTGRSGGNLQHGRRILFQRSSRAKRWVAWVHWVALFGGKCTFLSFRPGECKCQVFYKILHRAMCNHKISFPVHTCSVYEKLLPQVWGTTISRLATAVFSKHSFGIVQIRVVLLETLGTHVCILACSTRLCRFQRMGC